MRLLLLLFLITYSLSYDCSNDFKNIKTAQCTGIDTEYCYFYGTNCKTIKECSKGTETDCGDIIPPDFNINKCDYSGGVCAPKLRECNEFGQKPGDVCKNLYSGAATGKRCDFSDSNPIQCTSYFNKCEDIDDEEDCNSNIPSDYSKKCEWNDSQGKCETKTRNCEDVFARDKEDICRSKIPLDEAKKCIFINGLCHEKYEDCEYYEGEVEDTCQKITPFNSTKNGLDYSFKCELIDSDDAEGGKICKKSIKTCQDYSLGDFLLGVSDTEKCSYAKTSNDAKFRCTYDEKGCHEIERECNYYNERTTEKTEEGCKKIVPSNKNKECVFEDNICKEQNRKCEDMSSESLCEELKLEGQHRYCKWIEGSTPKCIENYDSCRSYEGKDKKTCINIVLNTPTNCILKHDSECIEDKLTCENAQNEEQCKIAEPSDSKKKCIFYDGHCFEEYERCGDYDGSNPTDCEGIILINGKRCVYKDSKCKTEIKKCNEALDKSECKLITKIGVTDPEYYRCNYDYDSTPNRCYQELMYCSDYNGTASTDCEKIKPYDESGTYIDVAYKCKIQESSVKCERVLKDCVDAGSSAATCKIISEKLEETSNKYCAFISGACTEQYKTCELYVPEEDETVVGPTKCKEIIPKNYKTHHCDTEGEGDELICVQKENDCEFYNYNIGDLHPNVNYDVNYWSSICTNIGQTCEYTPASGSVGEACTETSKSCNNIIFPSIKNENINYCTTQKTSADYRVCTLKIDKLGCEEFNKIINTPISYQDLDLEDNNEENTNTQPDSNTNEGNTNGNNNNGNNKPEAQTNYDRKKSGIFLIFILLSLLF